TTGMPAALRLSADKNGISTGSGDVAHIKIEVVDDNGYVVPDAEVALEVNVDGQGKLIGLDNGNPFDHTCMKNNQRKTFNGLALAVVQGGNSGGTIHIKVDSPGIKGSSIDIIVQKTETSMATIEDVNK